MSVVLGLLRVAPSLRRPVIAAEVLEGESMDAIDMWVTSMSSGDFDLSLLAEDARIWHSTDGLEMSVAEERALLESMRSAGRGVRTSGTRVRRHGGGAVLEYTLHVGESDGSTRDIPAVATVAVVDGRIARIDEYLLQEGEGVRDRSQWEVGRAPLADAHDRIFGEITRFGLERNVVELEVYGYTVLPPDVVGQPGLADRLLPEILAIAEKQTGVRADLAGGDGYGDMQAALGRGLYLNNMLMRGRVFEEALMNEPSLSLISYLLGEHCVLNQQSMMVKGPGGAGLALHADYFGTPAPFPYVPHVANATWALTDYTLDNGCLAVVRGSHHLCRQPTPAEGADKSLWHPVEVGAGSMIVWHGNLWHGAFPRRAPGLRVSMSSFFCRWGLLQQDQYRDLVTKEMLDRNPRRFALLTGLGNPSFSRPDGLNGEYRMRSSFDANRFSVEC